MTRPVSRQRAADRATKLNDEVAEKLKSNGKTSDSFQNFALSLGIGTDNALTGSTYGFNPITRIRTLLEWIYRGSWLGGIAIDIPADDMTRARIEYKSTMEPADIEAMVAAEVRLNLWGSMNSGFKWGRLYGGALVVPLIDGQDPSTPLRLESIRKGQLKGFMVLDRWMVEPSMEALVADLGPYLGTPMYYKVVADAPGLSKQKIHYSRCMRIEGIELPYWQKLSENMWGLSVIERLYDRMIAFDSATQGAAQLVYKSFLRTMKMKGLRQAAVVGGDALAGISAQVDMMRRYQGIEGVTLIDGDDEFIVDNNGSFSGIAEALNQFGQQLSGALKIPLTRMFGQSPSGFNTGDSDIRNYYDGIKHDQEKHRVPLTNFLHLIARSEGIPLPKDFGWEFRSLWQMDDIQKSDVAGKIATAVASAVDSQLISQKTGMMELRNSSKTTGIFASITDKDIESAEEDPPNPTELAMNPPGSQGEGAAAVEGEPAKSMTEGGKD